MLVILSIKFSLLQLTSFVLLVLPRRDQRAVLVGPEMRRGPSAGLPPHAGIRNRQTRTFSQDIHQVDRVSWGMRYKFGCDITQ